MKIKDFEQKIQKEIDKNLTIKTNPNAKDIAGVYYKGHFIGVSVPPEDIYEEVSTERRDAIGQPYKSIDMAFDFIKGKYGRIKDVLDADPDFFKDK